MSGSPAAFSSRHAPTAGSISSGVTRGQDLDLLEWKVLAGELVVLARVFLHALARDDEEALTEHGDTLLADVGAERLELPLRDLDQ